MDVQPSSRRKLWFPFHFDIPHSTKNPHDIYLGDPQRYHPPSLSISSEKAYNSADLFIRGECRISYGVRARLTTPDGQQTAETVHPVTFTPAHDSSPPLCASDFPGEYVLKTARTIGNFSSPRTKILSIKTEEPPPIQFYGARAASTVIKLRLSHHRLKNKSGSSESIRPPPDKFALVQSTLQAVTFLSVKPQDGIPRQRELIDTEIIMDKKVVSPPQNRKVRFSSWSPIMDEQSSQGKILKQRRSLSLSLSLSLFYIYIYFFFKYLHINQGGASLQLTPLTGGSQTSVWCFLAIWASTSSPRSLVHTHPGGIIYICWSVWKGTGM